MELKFFCTRWGSETLSWDDFLQKVSNAGYGGIEYGIANNTAVSELEQAWEMAAKYNLLIIPQHYETSDTDLNRHCDQYAAWLQKIEPFNAIKVNSQTGKDFFTFEQNKAIIDVATRFTERTGTTVYHETHRAKFPFAAHVTKEYLTKIPELQLTLDISHWVNVAESYLENQVEAVELAIARAGHLHARVGYPEGPQIADPRAPEWKEAVDHHLVWWKKIASKTKASGDDAILTVTPEFGPYPYMVHLPHSREPISSQWDINIYMMGLLREELG